MFNLLIQIQPRNVSNRISVNGSLLFLAGRRRWLPPGTVGDSLPWTGESCPCRHSPPLPSPSHLSSSSPSLLLHTSPSYPSPSPPLSSSSPSFSSHLSFTPLLLHPSRLLAHAHDPDLDKNTSREFIVYACPSGSLGTQIEDFMETALYQFGRNGSHKSIPHVTLCQFFKV